MQRYLTLWACLGLMALFSCGGSDDLGKDGLAPGMAVYPTFHYYITPGNTLASSEDAHTPPMWLLRNRDDASDPTYYLRGLQVGDTATFEIMARNFYMDMNGVVLLPDGVNNSDMITFHVVVDSVISKEEYDQRMADRASLADSQPRLRLQRKIAEQTQYLADVLAGEGVKERIAAEGQQIDAAIQAAGEMAFPTSTGVRLVILEEEMGDLISPGDYVRVNYVGTLMDGTVFDTNISRVANEHDMYNPRRNYEPFRFQLGTGGVILGWEDAFKTLSVGSKVKLYIPSPLAYGTRGSGAIPPNAPIIFEIEILDATKPNL